MPRKPNKSQTCKECGKVPKGKPAALPLYPGGQPICQPCADRPLCVGCFEPLSRGTKRAYCRTCQTDIKVLNAAIAAA